MSITLNHCSVSVSRSQFQSPTKPTTMIVTLNKLRWIKPSTFAAFFRLKSYSASVTSSKSNNLFSRISPLRHPSSLVSSVLEQWVNEGRKVQKFELKRIIRDLRSRKRFPQALQVSEWMSGRGLCTFSPSDCAVHLDLIGVVHGWNAAEDYFDSLKDHEKNDKTYGALFNCYAREGHLDKSLSHLQKMKEIGYASSTLVYNNLMSLYKLRGQLDKVPEVLEEMEKIGVSPDNFSYRICINCYAEKSDLTSLEKLLRKMEIQPHISMDWTTYSIVANYYIKANLKEKATFSLKKLENTLHKDAVGYNHLISLYAQLGKVDEMMRLWRVQKFVCKKHINRDYITMIGALVKLGELEKAEAVLKEWESSCHTWDFRVPNVLLIGYCQRDLIDKAEAMLHGIIKKGKVPIPNSWAIIAASYMKKDNMEKSLECMKEALAVKDQNPNWEPKPTLVSNLLIWLDDKGEAKELEGFVNSLKKVVPVNRSNYHAAIKANTRVGRDADWILEGRKADDHVEEDEEIENLVSLK